jgi:hypothetical protein
VKPWLRETPWELLVLANQQLCEKANCFHKISTAGGKKAEKLWEENRPKPMSLQEMVLFCKRIHFIEPFVNLNGNTLAAVALELNNLLDGTDSEVIKVNAIVELLNAKKQ